MTDALSDEERAALLRQAARRARKHRPHWLNTDDLTQAAYVALLEADAAGQLDGTESRAHLANKTRQRAFGAMLDEIRKGYREAPPIAGSFDDTGAAGSLPQPVSADDPERTAMLRQSIRHLARRGTAQLSECVALLAVGMTTDEIALVLDVSPSRVSQLKADARRLLDL